jgi:hypothetical protein
MYHPYYHGHKYDYTYELFQNWNKNTQEHVSPEHSYYNLNHKQLGGVEEEIPIHNQEMLHSFRRDLIFKYSKVKVPRFPDSVKTEDFVLLNGKKSPFFKTFAKLSYDDEGLIINYISSPNIKYIGKSPLLKCNDPLFNQQVCEVFIRPKNTRPNRYLELEINPYGYLWAGIDRNRKCTGNIKLKNEFIPCDKSGIIYHSTLSDQKKNWKAHIKIPWTFLRKYFGNGDFNNWMINLFCQRMDKEKNHVNNESEEELEDKCISNKHCTFTAWSPTYRYDPPAYHVCSAFREIELIKNNENKLS